MNRRSVILILCAILLALTAAVFQPARHYAFVNWDDFNEVTENPFLHPPSGEHLRGLWSGPHLDLYAPLSYSAWWVLSHVPKAADNPAAFHLLNIGLHLVCAGLVFSILIFCVKSPMAAFGGAAIFALHPVQVESVGWVSEMNNLLAAALSLGAIRLYLAFRTAPAKSRWWYFGAGFAVFVLALFAKPTAVVAPVIALILDLGFLRGNWRVAVATLFPWFVVAGVFAIVARSAQAGPAIRWFDRPIVAVDAMAFYCGKLFWPVGLTIDYGRTPQRVLSSHLWVSNLAIIVMLVIILWLVWRTQRGIVLGAMIMLAGLFPVLGLLPFAFQEYSTVADHFFYMGMLGPALACAVILSAVPGKGAAPIAAVLAVTLAVLSSAQLKIWANSAELVKQALAIDPGSAIGNFIVGAELDRTHQPAQAVDYFSAAVARDPTNSNFHYNLGNALFQIGEYERSIAEFQQAIALFQPPSWRAMNNLGVAYAKLGKRDDALATFRHVLDFYPDNPEAIHNLQIMQQNVPTK